MKRLVGLLAIFILASSVSMSSAQSHKELAKIDDSADVLQEITTIPEKSIPPSLLGNAGGIAIIPGVIKAGFIVGGRYGSGILMVKDRNGEWSNPVFITLAGGSIGWQIGVESIDIILVFKNSRSIESILRGKVTLGADAAIAAGPVGRSASAGTDIRLKSEIYSYSRSRGLFAGLSIEGAALQVDNEADDSFYGKYTNAGDIIHGKDANAPAQVERLRSLLSSYTKKEAEATAPLGEQQAGKDQNTD